MKYILKSDLKEMFFVGESFAVGDQKVCAKSILKFKYKKQTFWNTNSGGKYTSVQNVFYLIFRFHN